MDNYLKENDRHSIPLHLLAWAGAFYLAALAIFFREAFLFQRFLYRGLLLLHSLPNGEFAASWIGEGTLPIWNPYNFCGTPWLADMLNAAFYPLHLILFLLVGGAAAVNLEVLLHFWLAGLFMFAFAREHELSFPAALATGVIFMLNGFMVDYYDQLEGLRTMVWLPLLLLCLKRGAGRGSLRWMLAGGLVMGVQFLGGHFQYAVFNVLLAFTYLLYVELREPEFGWRTAGLRLLGKCLLVFGLGVGFFAVQLLPTWELTIFAARAKMPFAVLQENRNDLLSFSLVAKFIVPCLDGGPVDDVQPVYVGLSALMLTCLAVKCPRRGDAAFFLGVVIGSLLLMAGPHSPAYLLLYHAVPGFAFFKDPLRFVFLLLTALSVLVGLGLDVALNASREQTKAWRVPAILIWVIAALAVVLIYVPQLKVPQLVPGGFPFNEMMSLPYFGFLMRDLAAACAGLMLIFWLGWSVEKTSRIVRGVGSVVLLLAGLFPFSGMVAIETAPASIFEPEKSLVKVIRDSGEHRRVFVHPALVEQFYDYEFKRELKTMGIIEEAPDWRNEGLLGATPARLGIPSGSGFSVLSLQSYVEMTNVSEFDPRLHSLNLVGGVEILNHPERFRWLGCSWILAPASQPLPRPLLEKWKLVKRTEHVSAYFNPDVDTSAVVFSDIKGLDEISKTPLSPLKSPNEIRLRTDCTGALKFPYLFYPSWKVWKDGEKCETESMVGWLFANVSNRTGSEVLAVFEPLSFKLGLALSLMTFSFWCGLMAFGRSRRFAHDHARM